MFGKFKDIESFLQAYQADQEMHAIQRLHPLPVEEQIELLRAAPVPDLAEVKATIKVRQADDKSSPKHYNLIVTLTEILQFTTSIKADIQQCKKNHLPVFVAIRYGDRSGISQPITSGMNAGDIMHFKGQWITTDKVSGSGGARMPVLHFTHHPVGFTCTIHKCYS